MKHDERPPAVRRPPFAQRASQGLRGLPRPDELPGPFRRSFWRSPIRGPWLTSILGLILLAGLSVVFVTGLLSYAAYNPDLNRINDQTPGKGLLGFYLFSWPTHPVWLYRLNQGVHVTLGLVLIPILLAKLWSVLPKLFEWPPLRSPAHALERLSLLLLVGGVGFEFVTGILNIQQWYKFPGSFYVLHFYGAWVFIAALVVHTGLKSRTVIGIAAGPRPDGDAARRYRPYRAGTAGRLGSGQPGAGRADDLAGGALLAFAGPASLLMLVVTVGQSLGGPLRRTALLAPHGQDLGNGPNDFQINQTAASVGIRTRRRPAPAGGSPSIALPARSHAPPEPGSSCWPWRSTPRPADRLRRGLVHRRPGLDGGAAARSRPARRDQPAGERAGGLAGAGGAFRHGVLSAGQIMDPDSLLALRVNGVDLSLDHGYPARVIVPANPGVHNTKWVASLTFAS